MPVEVQAEVRRLDEAQFGKIAYEVMGHAFAVHREFGRLFDESIYQVEIAQRCGGAMEVPVRVFHGTFAKTYYLDLLVGNGALFELKTADVLNDRHRSQLLNYLMLTELAHGKLVNMRNESVQHEFVNSSLTLAHRREFVIQDRGWIGSPDLKGSIESLLRDLGTGLDLSLYEEATCCQNGSQDNSECFVPIFRGDNQIGVQSVSFAGPAAPFQFTAYRTEDCERAAAQFHRFVNHTRLPHLHWINVTRGLVTFKTVLPKSAAE